MAKYNGANAFILLDGYDLTQYTLDLSVAKEAVFEETHTFGDSWVEQLPVGLSKATVTQNAFYDDATLGTNIPLVGLAGTSRNLMLGVEGATLGEEYIAFEGDIESKYDRTVSRGALHKVTATHSITGAVEEGILLNVGAANGTPGTGTGVNDVAAATTNGGVGHLHVTALSLGGYTNLAGVVKHSTTDGTYVLLATFATVAVAPASARIAVAAGTTVNKWLRFEWTYTGAGAGPTATAYAGFSRS